MANITFQVEDWFAARPEMEWLLPFHWEEIANDKDKIKLDPWWEAYDELASTGQLQIVTARATETCGKCINCDNSKKGKVVGYHWSIIRPHLHYRESLTAYTDIYFLHRPYRRGMNGANLFRAAEKGWKDRGVQKAYTASKVKLDMSKIFLRQGWHRAESCFTKMIGL